MLSRLFLSWQARTAMPQPILTIAAVPSPLRSEINDWIIETVAPDAQTWLSALTTRSQTWLDSKHQKGWAWRRQERSDLE